jgi:hypothetical protein
VLARKLSWLFCGGHGTFLSTGATRYFDAPRKNGFAYAALAVTKFYEKKNILDYTEIAIGAHQERLCQGNLFPLYACEKNVGPE